MSTDLDTTRIVRSWLRTDEHDSADRVLDIVLILLDTTPQRRSWPAWRFVEMNSFTKLAIAAAAVVVVALVGITFLPRGSSDVGGAAPSASPSASASPIASASASPSASPSGGADVWHGGLYEAGQYEATLDGVAFSFAVPAKGWSSYRYVGMLEKGTYPTANYAWVGMPSPDSGQVATDPCSGKSRFVDGTVDDLAQARTTIPGTDAVGPTDTTIGGIPAKLVVLTIHPDIDCGPRDFMLAGDGGSYPNSLESRISYWLFEMDGTRYVIYSDQSGPNPSLAQEIEQIVKSIKFD